jgi:hypothetical protein
LIEVDLGPRKDTFGFQSFLSFLDHVDCYQHVQHLQHGKDIIKFKFVNNGVPVYDIFEFYSNCDTIFQDTNIIVVETLNQFLNIVNKLDLTKKYIIFSESYWDVKKYDLNLDYELIYMPWDLVDCQNRLSNRSNLYFHLIDLDFGLRYKPQYDFLCLVGRSKTWRDKFIEKLASKVDLSNSLTSYYGKCLGNEKLLDIDIAYERSNSKLEFENKFYQPIKIPGTNFKYNLSYFTKNELFYSTKFSVVVETEAELEEYHITEKTIKCIMSGHPFVVMGTPKYLKFLHSLGLTTYNDLFDESYDSIYDIEDRMESVISLVQKLQTKVFDVKKLQDIQNRNLNALIKLRNTDTYEKFLGLFNV